MAIHDLMLCQRCHRLDMFPAGVQSASEIEVVVTDRSISVRVPDRYRLVRLVTYMRPVAA